MHNLTVLSDSDFLQHNIVYKGKGDALTCGSYRGIKLLEHAKKVLERVIEGRGRKIVKIDNMQFGFMAGRSTTDALFI